MRTVSFNGTDRSGKSEQIALLKWRGTSDFHFTRPIIHYSTRWPKLDPLAHSKWWFEEVPIHDFVEIMIESLNARDSDRIEDLTEVWDRGPRMCQAVCAAVWAIREENKPLEELLNRVGQMFKRGLHIQPDTEIRLGLDKTYMGNLAQLVAMVRPRPERPKWMNERYARYQANLGQALEILDTEKAFDFEHTASSCCAIAVHNNVSEFLASTLGYGLGPVLTNLRLILGLSGMSESGKDSIGEFLRREYGATRLKFRYFSQYLLSSGQDVGPRNVSYEVLRFAQMHGYPLFTVESLHGYGASAFLKLLLGDRYQVVFVDTKRAQRIRRSADHLGITLQQAEQDIARRDQQKMEGGIEEVRSLADHLVDNNHSWANTAAEIKAVVESREVG